MKTVKRNLKWAAKILSFLLLLQSCTVYHSYSSTVDEAIASNNRVKLNIENSDPYKFKQLQLIEGQIFGLAHHNSKTYKMLSSRKIISSEYQKSSYVQVFDEELKDIQLENKPVSLILSIGGPILITSALLVIPYLAY